MALPDGSAARAPVAEPRPAHPNWPRYSNLPFPAYRFVPGLNAHPRRDPRGHSFGQPAQPAPSWEPEEWRTLLPYLYGIDLYNHAFWWEAHEALESLWHAARRESPAAAFLQGIIHLAAANLNRHRGKTGGARRQRERALAQFARIPGPPARYMGVDLPGLIAAIQGMLSAEGDVEAPLIALEDIASGSRDIVNGRTTPKREVGRT
jgi:predicted metal-dependent hydrolase